MNCEDFYNSVRAERSYLPEWGALPNKQRKKWQKLLDIIELRVNRLAGETYENSKPKE